MYPEKPKRKPISNPYSYIAVGIIIGVLVTGVALYVFTGSRGSVTVVEEAPVEVVSAAQMQVVPQATVIARSVLDAEISPDGTALAVLVWDEGRALLRVNQLLVAQNLTSDTRFTWYEGSYESKLSFNANSNLLLVASSDLNQVVVLDAMSGDAVMNTNGRAAAFLPDGSLVVASDHLLMHIYPDGSQPAESVPLNQTGVPYRMAASPDGSKIALVTGASNGWAVHIFDTGNWNAAPQIYSYGSYIHALAFHPSGRYLGVTLENGGQVIDLEGGGTRAYNFENRGMARAIAFSPAGDMLVIASGDASSGLTSRIYAVRWAESDLIPPFEDYFVPTTVGTHDHDIQALSFTADGYLLSAGNDGSVRLWDLEQQRELSRFQI